MTVEVIEKIKQTPLSVQDGRDIVLAFEKQLSSFENVFYGDTDNCPLKHSFAEGCYVREILIPKGTIIVGKIHKHCHPSFILKGDVSVYTAEEGVKRIKAPLSFISPAGVKRVVYAHEDCVWITVHVTDKTDLAEIEDFVIAKSFDEVDNFINEKIVNELKGAEL